MHTETTNTRVQLVASSLSVFFHCLGYDTVKGSLVEGLHERLLSGGLLQMNNWTFAFIKIRILHAGIVGINFFCWVFFPVV